MALQNEKEFVLYRAFSDVIWMAIRYAHGRHTYAPGMVREAVEEVRKLYPNFTLQIDNTLKPRVNNEGLEDDYLEDLFID